MVDYQPNDQNTESDMPDSSTSETVAGATQPPAGSPRFSLLFVGLTFVAALFLGVAIGYGFGRSQSEPPVQVVVTATPVEVVAQASDNPTQSAEVPNAATGQPTPTIMDFVLADARHFQGSADASITMVEFSDFK